MDDLLERVRSIMENPAEVTPEFRLEEIEKVLDCYEKYYKLKEEKK